MYFSYLCKTCCKGLNIIFFALKKIGPTHGITRVISSDVQNGKLSVPNKNHIWLQKGDKFHFYLGVKDVNM
jgi:hypothetical protein